MCPRSPTPRWRRRSRRGRTIGCMTTSIKNFTDPASAVAYVTGLYDAQIAQLRDALQRFVAGETFTQRVRARYPQVRVHSDTVARGDSRLAYGFVAGPG